MIYTKQASRLQGLEEDKMSHEMQDGPCNCSCHDHPVFFALHFTPCCAYTYVPRHRAEAVAAKLRTEQERQSMLALGAHHAPILDVLRVFTDGPNHDWALREVPNIKKGLESEGKPFEVMSDMALYTGSELSGPQCRYSGNKSKSWMAWAMRQFGLEHKLSGH
ncbi:MAG: hypothetical protein Q8P36_02725 [bacterium]|nr:hypothetical protein [bacterium]